MSTDQDDMKKINKFFDQHDPLIDRASLTNIVNGVTANEKVNVDEAVRCGEKILKDMEGKTANEFKFSIAMKAVNMAHKFKVKANGTDVEVDPDLLFQRLTAMVLSSRNKDFGDLFSYELRQYSSLAKSSTELNDVSKSDLLAELKTIYCSNPIIQKQPGVMFVIDGGYLIHRMIYYKKGSSVMSIVSDICFKVKRK